MKQRAALILTFVFAAGGFANVVCAAVFGAVLSRFSSDWVYFRDEPGGFLLALILSFLASVCFSVFGAAIIISARHERRYWARRSSLPPVEDSSNVTTRRSG